MSSLTGFHVPAFPPQDRFIHLALKSPGGFTEPAAMKFSLLKRLLSRIHPSPSADVLGAQPRHCAERRGNGNAGTSTLAQLLGWAKGLFLGCCFPAD